MAKHRATIWPGRRKALARLCGLDGPGEATVFCHWCGEHATMKWFPRYWDRRGFLIDEKIWFSHEIDHVKPVSLGGTNDLDNLVLACWRCNSARSNKHHVPPYLLETR